MYCSNCGKELKEGALFCSNCGFDLKQQMFGEKTKKKKKLLRVIIIVSSCLLLLAIIVSGVYYLFFIDKENQKDISEDEWIQNSLYSVVKVITYDFSGNELANGSGFVMFKSNIIVTNYHVIEDAYSASIVTENEVSYKVDGIIGYEEDKDLALLKIEDKFKDSVECLERGNSDEIKKGDEVIAIGSPMGMINTVSKGIFSNRINFDDLSYLEITAEIEEGSSGGALFDKEGKVIGVTCAKFKNYESYNLAIPIEYVEKLYNQKNGKIVSIEEFYKSTPIGKLISKAVDTVGEIKETTFHDLKYHSNDYLKSIVDITCYVSSINSKNRRKYKWVECYLCEDYDYSTGHFNYDNDIYVNSKFYYHFQ